MKKNLIILILIFLSSVNSVFGSENIIYRYEFNENTRTFIFGDNARVRKDPEIKSSNVIDSLPIGEEITIIKKTAVDLTVEGYKAPWYRISYKKNNSISEGYVWGGLLSIGFARDKEKLFLAGIKKYHPGKGFTGECRLIIKGKVLSAIPFEPHYMPDGNNGGYYGYSVSTEIHGSRGLDGLKCVLKFFFNYEACGYPRGNVWIGCTDNKLYYIGKDTSVSEAGVFHVEEKFIFPDENKNVNKEIILVKENYDFDEHIKDYKLTERKEQKFFWRNYKLIPAK